MSDLFKSEVMRFRGWAVALTTAHLIALAFMARMVDMAQQPLLVHWVFGGMYAVAGLLLGLYQMGTYRKPGHWLNLLHRPLAHSRIAAALFGAGGMLLALVVAVPMLLVTLWQVMMTAHVVDLRHWLLPLSAWLIAMCAYFAGGFGALRGVRYAGAGLVLLIWLIASGAHGFGLLAVELIAFFWLSVLLLIAFKPNLSAPPLSAMSTVIAALPLQMSVYLLVMIAFAGIEMLWVAQGSHPNSMPTPLAGGHNEVERMDARGRMLAGLRDSAHPDAALLREQIKLSEPQQIAVSREAPKLPQRNELANLVPMEFDDARRSLRWVFSHDDMRLHGYDLKDKRSVGSLGVGASSAPFAQLVLPNGELPGMHEGDAVLMGGSTLYQYVSETKQVLPRISVLEGETLLSTGPIGESLAVMSDRALYFYDGRALVENTLPAASRVRVSMPGAMADLRNLELIELIDGYLIGFTFSVRPHTMEGVAPYQVMLRTHDDGSTENINRRALKFDYPALYRYRAWWPSPLLHAMREQALSLFAPAPTLNVAGPMLIPREVMIIASVLALLSLLGAIWRTKQTALSGAARMAWIVTCGAIGLPALASLWLMVPRRECEEELPLVRTATA